MKKRSSPKKIKPKRQQTPTIPLENVAPLHISFPLTLHHKSENKLCFFRDEYHMMKYIERAKLQPKDYKVSKTQEKEE